MKLCRSKLYIVNNNFKCILDSSFNLMPFNCVIMNKKLYKCTKKSFFQANNWTERKFFLYFVVMLSRRPVVHVKLIYLSQRTGKKNFRLFNIKFSSVFVLRLSSKQWQTQWVRNCFVNKIFLSVFLYGSYYSLIWWKCARKY